MKSMEFRDYWHALIKCWAEATHGTRGRRPQHNKTSVQYTRSSNKMRINIMELRTMMGAPCSPKPKWSSLTSEIAPTQPTHNNERSSHHILWGKNKVGLQGTSKSPRPAHWWYLKHHMKQRCFNFRVMQVCIKSYLVRTFTYTYMNQCRENWTRVKREKKKKKNEGKKIHGSEKKKKKSHPSTTMRTTGELSFTVAFQELIFNRTSIIMNMQRHKGKQPLLKICGKYTSWLDTHTLLSVHQNHAKRYC